MGVRRVFVKGVIHKIATWTSNCSEEKFDKKRQQISLEKLYQKLGFLLVACHGLFTERAPGYGAGLMISGQKLGWKRKKCCVSLEPVEHSPPSKTMGPAHLFLGVSSLSFVSKVFDGLIGRSCEVIVVMATNTVVETLGAAERKMWRIPTTLRVRLPKTCSWVFPTFPRKVRTSGCFDI